MSEQLSEEKPEVAVVVDSVGASASLEAALEQNDVVALHAREPEQAVQIVRALGTRCLVVLGRLWTLRARLELLVRLKEERPDCANSSPVVVTDPVSSDVPADAPCVVAKTDAREAHLLRAFFGWLLLHLGWRTARVG